MVKPLDLDWQRPITATYRAAGQQQQQEGHLMDCMVERAYLWDINNTSVMTYRSSGELKQKAVEMKFERG